MRIKRNEKYEERIRDKVREYLSNNRKGIHVSDLLFPRDAYFRKTSPIPLTDEEVGCFVAGRAHHAIIEALLKKDTKFKREYDVVWEGIHGTIDLLQDVPVEIKTTRRTTPTTIDSISEHYLIQLGFYCAMIDSRKGRLLIFHLGVYERDSNGKNRLIPKFMVFEIDFKDLKSIKTNMRKRRDLLLKALDTKDHTILPKCPDWKCNPTCKYWHKCVGNHGGK